MTQCELVYAYMSKWGSITQRDAVNDLNCYRLSARIYDLIQQGHNINSENVTENGKTFARYSLKKEFAESLF